MLELVVAVLLFAIALGGLCPLVVMQSKQLQKLQSRFSSQATYYLAPATDDWTRKLGAAAGLQSQDPGAGPQSPILLIDNADTGYSETGTGWNTETLANAYLGSARAHPSGSGANGASWQFNISAGWYTVQVTWAEGAGRATNATFTVKDGDTVKGSAVVDQTMAPSGTVSGGRPWQTLGTFSIHGNTLEVTLTDQANGVVVADGVQLIPVANVIQVLGWEKTLTGQEVTAHVSVTVVVPQ
jgi:hypothetical protein